MGTTWAPHGPRAPKLKDPVVRDGLILEDRLNEVRRTARRQIGMAGGFPTRGWPRVAGRG